MPQETNLNVSPYFDDFDSAKNYHKVLFKPGYPIQARELSTLQTILQNQIEQFGNNIFKDGSVVVPGQLKYENPFYAVELESTFNGIPISLYFDQLIGKQVEGQNSGVVAQISYLLNSTDSERNSYTIYVKYLQSGGSEFTNKRFQDGETLLLRDPLQYGNYTFQVGQGVCNARLVNAISEGSSISVDSGVFFVRGFFISVDSQTILLDQYGITPSYKVGFNIIESIVTADEDESLFDNAQGFSNYAAPGADRFKIQLELAKRPISETNSINFVELMRIENGAIQYFNENPQYNLIKKELAQRTYDESGDYFVNPFSLLIKDSLNDKVLNFGLFSNNQLTSQGNTPSEELMVYEIGPGKAYVKGYEVETKTSKLLDVPKPRTTATVKDRVLNFNAGILVNVNNVYGSPNIGLGVVNSVKLMDSRIGEFPYSQSGNEIGLARVYDYVPESNYVNDTSVMQLRLFDIETYTTIKLTQQITLTTPSVIKGKRSNATGFLRQNVSNSNTLSLYGVSGNFLKNEPISINEIDNNCLISDVIDYTLSDIKSVYSNVGVSTFNADVIFNNRLYLASSGTTFNINNKVVSAGFNNNFTNTIKIGDIVSYASTTYTGDPIYNKVTAVGSGGTSFTIAGITTVSGVCNGKLQDGTFNVTNLFKLTNVFSSDDSSLMTKLDKSNVSSISFSNTQISQRRLFSSVPINSDSTLSITIDSIDTDVYFDSFDEDKFVITYADGTIEKIRSDKFSRSLDGKTLTFNGLLKSSGIADVITTVINKKPNSKTKKLNKTSTLVISNSKLTSSGIGTTTLNDGLTYNNIYGTRVQDEEISLNVPDIVRVLAVYESSGTNDPTLPYLQLSSFSGSTNSNQDYNIGEIIVGTTSGAAAIIVGRKESDKLEFVYLNTFSFELNETIKGNDTNTTSIIIEKELGDKNITQNFLLDNGQKEHFYDYGRIIRKPNIAEPTKRLKIIFQNFTIDYGDTGEFITVNSYPSDSFKSDISIFDNTRLSDVIDIRPRVAPYTPSSYSPFEFNGRNFALDGQYSKYTLSPGGDLVLTYSYYQGRIDLINLNSDGNFEVIQGIPSDVPVAPSNRENTLDIARVNIPPYVFNVNNVSFNMMEHKRYRMSDIALLENRIDRVERFSTLSALESKTENFIIKDADTGLDRFKCGFFVDNFSSHLYHDIVNPKFSAAIDTETNTLRPRHYTTSLDLQLDSGSNGIAAADNLITLNYNEVPYLGQLKSSTSESVTPFISRFWMGSITLNPSQDNWVADPSPANSNTTTNTNPVNTAAPVSQSGLQSNSFDWISNANTIISSLTTRSSFNLGSSGANATQRYLSNSRAAGVGVVGDDIVIIANANRFSTKLTTDDLDAIKKLVPLDIANNFISQIRDAESKNSHGLLKLTYNSKTNLNNNQNPTTSSVSNTSSQLRPPTTNSTSAQTQPLAFLRSRNIEFDVRNLKPLTRFYSFFQGRSVDSYVAPKLLEIEMISGSFQTGETIQTSSTFVGSFIRFRLAKPNHKFGNINTPSETFASNPYNQQPIPTNYTSASTFLNIDIESLRLPSEVNFYGTVSPNMILVGQTSGARARVSNIRLVSDISGRLIGSLFIPSPTVSGNPTWSNGQNSFTVVDTPTLTASNQISQVNESFATAQFNSSGSVTIPATTTPPTQVGINTNYRIVPYDPLAQSFYIKDEDSQGIFLTSIDVYFKSKDNTIPVTLQIRPMDGGVPSTEIIPYSEVTLEPSAINLSNNGSVPTKFTFRSPVYLSGINQNVSSGIRNSQYSIVLLSSSANYSVFVSEVGQNDLISNQRISDQPDLGSLFKSQNGSTWNPSQLQDLKYQIYRANFNTSGLVRFVNPVLGNGNQRVTITGENQFKTLSKKIIVGLGSTGYSQTEIVPGVTLKQGTASGKLVGIAGSVALGVGVTITNVGSGYTAGPFPTVSLITETGYGSGAVVEIITDSVTTGIGTVNVKSGGTGYQVGDSLIIPEIGSGLGYGGKVSVLSVSSNNTFVIDNVQGSFGIGSSEISYVTSSGITSSIGAGVTISSITPDSYNDGLHLKVSQVNHGMHSVQNIVKISNFRPEVTEVNSKLSSDITPSTISIPLNSGTGIGFTTFEGIPVTPLNPGYVVIGNEIIGYTGVSNDTLTSSLSLRGIDGSLPQSYTINTPIYKYQLEGVSLRRINKTHDLAFVDPMVHPKDFDSYYIKIETGSKDYNGVSIGSTRTDDLYFNRTVQTGNTGTNITNNIQYEVLTPIIQNTIFAGTNISSRVRTITGTSLGGNEESFIDRGFENINLNASHYFDSPRLICSVVNETNFISNTPAKKSVTLELVLETQNPKLSPVIDKNKSSIMLTSNLINNPIGINNDQGYADDDSVRSLTKDKHSVIYLSKPVKLRLPANSIKVVLSAYISDKNDIRVLYQTFRNDSPNSGSSFDLFPGWSNYTVDGQGIKRVTDFSRNNGSPDSKVQKNSEFSFKDYEFSVDDLADFDAFAIKIVMSSNDQADPPLIKDLRAIATVKPRI